MPSPIFLVGVDNHLTELQPSEYASEELLQKLLADHPAILGVAGAGPLLLVAREFGVPEHSGGSERWSLDHLFLSRDAVPVLVETKRSSDTRARREVVAQMLDYAANGVIYWPIEQIVASFRDSNGPNSDGVLEQFLQGQEPDGFWRQVESNLRSGRIVMVFVADKIAHELKRIVEFLNEQMRLADVFAIEIEQFVSDAGVRTLVPRLLGATERAQAAKAVEPNRPIVSEDAWLKEFQELWGEATTILARRTINWLRSEGFEVGISNSQDSFYAGARRPDDKFCFPFFLRKSSARFETSLQNLRYTAAYADEKNRAQLLDELRRVSNRLVATDKLNGWPSVPLDDLSDEGVWKRLQKIAAEVRIAIVTGHKP
jgi:hypothetical protein